MTLASETTGPLPLRGGCRCGAVRWQARGPFLLHYKCHCLDCQRTSGGGAVALSWLRTEGFAYTGTEPGAHTTASASGRPMTRRFCPQCGALARPNILMFGDWGWLESRTAQQEQAMTRWRRRVERLLVIEIGAGSAIPTVRRLGESLPGQLVRINPREAQIAHGKGVSIAEGSYAALSAIEAALGARA